MIRSVAYLGTYDPDYPRNAVIMSGLRELGVEVKELHAALPPVSAADMATRRGAALLLAGVVAAHARLLSQHRRELDVDAIVVGYPGHFVVPFARALSAYRRATLVFDPLVSLWDTFAGDRGLVETRGWKAAGIRAVDRVAFALPRLVLADTRAHAAFYEEALAVPRRRLAVVPVGAMPEPQATGASRGLTGGEPLVVLQYGKWSPLHGAEIVIEAAALLRDEPFRFELAGEGQSSGALRADIARLGLTNVRWLGPQTPAALRARVLAADVCLGVFGRSAKAGRVIPNKVYDALACGRPVVTADSPGARELLRDDDDALLVPAGDAQALAGALRRLADGALRARLGAAGLALYCGRLTPASVAARLLEALEAV